MTIASIFLLAFEILFNLGQSQKKLRTKLSFFWKYPKLQIQALEHSTGLLALTVREESYSRGYVCPSVRPSVGINTAKTTSRRAKPIRTACSPCKN